MSHNKRIETSREIRLWGGLAVTTVATILVVASNPYVRMFVEEKWENLKSRFGANKLEIEKKGES